MWSFIIRNSTENKGGAIDYNEREKQLLMLSNVVNYAWSKVCRRKQILSYFGEDYKGNCRKCDVCLS